MRHIELHLIENSEDQRQGNEIGLDSGDDEICETCFAAVGESVDGKKFVPFFIVLDEDAEWIVCLDCADPVL